MAPLPIKFFENFESELKTSKSLRFFSFGLVLVHLLTSLFWNQQDAFEIISNSNSRICWPIFSDCHDYFVFTRGQAVLLMAGYVSLIFLTFAMYFKTAKKFWVSLLLLELYKVVVQFLDYRFMGNYHFMPHILTLAFLFFPNRKVWAQIWLVSFYWGAALLKVNPEWLS